MAKRKNTTAKRAKNPVTRNTKIIKADAYDGSQSSSDFVVSGHSTGAANTEMDELSMQVTRDANAPRSRRSRGAGARGANARGARTQNQNQNQNQDQDQTQNGSWAGGLNLSREQFMAWNRDVANRVTNSAYWNREFAIWSSLGVAAAALAGFSAYRVYQTGELAGNRNRTNM